MHREFEMADPQVPLTEQSIVQYGDFAPFIPLGGRMALGAGNPNSDFLNRLTLLEESFETEGDYGRCCVAAVWLFSDFLDESHTVSQSIPGQEGSYLHGIMHRREGDFSNAKYWFRKAGQLEFFESLANQIQADSVVLPILRKEMAEFDPFALTDLVASQTPETIESLERVTFLELFAVFDLCFRRYQ